MAARLGTSHAAVVLDLDFVSIETSEYSVPVANVAISFRL